MTAKATPGAKKAMPSTAAAPAADRRLFLFGLPVAGLTLFAWSRARGAAPEPPDQPRATHEPEYRETELVRRYYQRARF